MSCAGSITGEITTNGKVMCLVQAWSLHCFNPGRNLAEDDLSPKSWSNRATYPQVTDWILSLYLLLTSLVHHVIFFSLQGRVKIWIVGKGASGVGQLLSVKLQTQPSKRSWSDRVRESGFTTVCLSFRVTLTSHGMPDSQQMHLFS
jgi:hypothetical protein